MTRPKISIIVPIYNVEPYLEHCIQSLIDQTLKEIEIILVDDESPDKCPEKCDEYATIDTRIKVLHKKNGGLGLARNSGLELATGEFVAFLDSDDFVDSKMYQELYEKVKQYDSDTCYCGYFHFDGKDALPVIEGIKDEQVFQGDEEIKKFLFNMIGMPTTYPREMLINVCVWRAIYSLDLIRQHGIRFVSERDIASEDIMFHATYLPLSFCVCYIPSKYYYYRFNPNSISHTYPSWKRKALMKSCSEIKNIFERHYKLEEYMPSYQRHLYRNLKTLIRKESQNLVSFSKQVKSLTTCLNESEFFDLFNHSFKYRRLPISQQVIYLLAKWKMSVFLILLVKFLRK